MMSQKVCAVGLILFIFLVPVAVSSGDRDDAALENALTFEENQHHRLEFIRDFFSAHSEQVLPANDATELDSFIVTIVDSLHVPGVAACIVKDNEVVWHGEYGYADVGHGVEVTDSTLFMLASISKTFVATALMQLWEDGLFDLDDDVNTYLPFPVRNPLYPDTPITFRMILAHTSSIARNDQFWLPLLTWGADSPIPLDYFLQNWLLPGGVYYRHTNYKQYPPGAGGQYSNIAFALAGYLVEQLSGQAFEEYCRDSVFGPLGMDETSWFLSELDFGQIAMPTGYDGFTYYQYGQYGFPVYPCGQLRTSALQLARHLVAFMNDGGIDGHQVLDSSTVELMTEIQYPHIRVFPDIPEMEWGLGWYGVDTGDGYIWGHDGGLFGVTTAMWCYPEEKMGTIILTNGDANEGISLIFSFLFLFALDNDDDGIINGFDNCPFVYNPAQKDSDDDGIGDTCLRGDVDGDGRWDVLDVVAAVYHILDIEPLDDAARWRTDCDGDGTVDILDVLGIVNTVLGTGLCVQ